MGTQNQTSTTSTLLATVEPAMTTTAACAVERRMQAMAVWPSQPGAILTLSTPSTRPTRTPRRRMGRGKKCFKASGQVFQASNTKSFLPASLHPPPLLPPTAPHHRYQSHWRGMGGGGGANPPKNPPRFPKKHTHVDIKKILSPSKLAVSI